MGYEFTFYEMLVIENFQEERQGKLFLCMFLQWLFCVNSRGWLVARKQNNEVLFGSNILGQVKFRELNLGHSVVLHDTAITELLSTEALCLSGFNPASN